MFTTSYTLKTGEILNIREAETKDAAAIISYLRKIAGESDFLTFGEGEFQKTLAEEETLIREHSEGPNRIFLVAEIGDQIAGILNVNASQKPRLQHIGVFGISVQKAFWGKGVGSCLMQSMLEWAKNNPIIRKIDLEVLVTNTQGVALYEKFGFEHEGVRKRHLYLHGEFTDAYAMGILID